MQCAVLRRARHLLAVILIVCALRVVRPTTETNCNYGGATCLALLAKNIAGLGNQTTNTTRVMDVVNSYATCGSGSLVSGDAELRPIRILAPQQLKDFIGPIANQFTKETGYEVLFKFVPLLDVQAEMIAEASRGLTLHDGWISDSVATVDLAVAGALAPLDDYVAEDSDFRWTDVMSYYRDVSGVYNRTVVGLTLGGKLSVFYYRKDLFQAYNLTVPATWEDMLQVAKLINGTDFNRDGSQDYPICWQIGSCLETSVVLSQILASMTQSSGLSSGWLFDPNTMTPLVSNEAMLKALQLFQDLSKYTWPDRVCERFHRRFLQGQCIMTVKWDELFKGIELVLPALKGRVGYSALPGSTHVLDRTTGQLVPCTATLCPYAAWEKVPTAAGGPSMQLVNRAPHSGLGGIAGMVNAFQTPLYKKATYELFAYFSSPNVSLAVVTGSTPVGPYRSSHLAYTDDDLQRWKGYNASDVRDFLKTQETILLSQNIAMDLRIMSGPLYREVLMYAGEALLAGAPPAAVHVNITAQFQAILAASGPLDKVQYSYATGLGLKVKAHTPSPQPSTPARAPQGSKGLTQGGTAGVVVACVAGAALALLLGLWVYRRGRMQSLFGKILAPRVGTSSTLIVTDVESSTLLWEAIDAEIMNTALEMHHLLIRNLLAKHHGYESATEGDSFIAAFHGPADALRFSEALQKDLLDVDWPDELLQHPSAAPVWVRQGMAARTPNARRGSILGAMGMTSTRLSIDSPKPQISHSQLPINTDRSVSGPGKMSEGGSRSLRQLLLLMTSRKAPAPAAQLGSDRQQHGTVRFFLPALFGSFAERMSGGSGYQASDDGSHRIDVPAATSNGSSIAAVKDRAAARPNMEQVQDQLTITGPASLTGASEVYGGHMPARSVMDTTSAAGARALSFQELPAGVVPASPAPISQAGGIASGGWLTVRDFYTQQWRPCAPPRLQMLHGQTDMQPTKQRLVFRGLRVRVGVHSGIHDEADVSMNKVSGRVQYGGASLAMAKAVGDAGHGGMVLLSQAAFEQLPLDKITSFGLVFNCGDHLFLKDPALLPTSIYMALPSELEGRMVLLPPTLRATEQLQAGVLSAPLGDVTISFTNVVGASALLAWDKQLAMEAFETFQLHAIHQLSKYSSGYLVELAAGLCLASFGSPLQAVEFGLQLVQALKLADWNEELLAHGLCEEVLVGTSPNSFYEVSRSRDPSYIHHAPPSLRQHQPLGFPADAGSLHKADSRGSQHGQTQDSEAQLPLFLTGTMDSIPECNQWAAASAVPPTEGRQQPSPPLSTRPVALQPQQAGALHSQQSDLERRMLSEQGVLILIKPASAEQSTMPPPTEHPPAAAVASQPTVKHYSRTETNDTQPGKAADHKSGGVTSHGGPEVLFRGPRVKIGLDLGQVHAHISPATGRITYRGKVLNRTARVADKAGSGQVWCTMPVWDACKAAGEQAMLEHGLDGTALRPVQLKGLPEPISLVHCRLVPKLPTIWSTEPHHGEPNGGTQDAPATACQASPNTSVHHTQPLVSGPIPDMSERLSAQRKTLLALNNIMARYPGTALNQACAPATAASTKDWRYAVGRARATYDRPVHNPLYLGRTSRPQALPSGAAGAADGSHNSTVGHLETSGVHSLHTLSSKLRQAGGHKAPAELSCDAATGGSLMSTTPAFDPPSSHSAAAMMQQTLLPPLRADACAPQPKRQPQVSAAAAAAAAKMVQTNHAPPAVRPPTLDLWALSTTGHCHTPQAGSKEHVTLTSFDLHPGQHSTTSSVNTAALACAQLLDGPMDAATAAARPSREHRNSLVATCGRHQPQVYDADGVRAASQMSKDTQAAMAHVAGTVCPTHTATQSGTAEQPNAGSPEGAGPAVRPGPSRTVSWTSKGRSRPAPSRNTSFMKSILTSAQGMAAVRSHGHTPAAGTPASSATLPHIAVKQGLGQRDNAWWMDDDEDDGQQEQDELATFQGIVL